MRLGKRYGVQWMTMAILHIMVHEGEEGPEGPSSARVDKKEGSK